MMDFSLSIHLSGSILIVFPLIIGKHFQVIFSCFASHSAFCTFPLSGEFPRASHLGANRNFLVFLEIIFDRHEYYMKSLMQTLCFGKLEYKLRVALFLELAGLFIYLFIYLFVYLFTYLFYLEDCLFRSKINNTKHCLSQRNPNSS